MSELTKQHVWNAMRFFNTKQPNTLQKTKEELALLSAAVMSDLIEEGFTAERFLGACVKYRKTSSFLPDSAALLRADKALRNENGAGYHEELPALPAWPTPENEQAAINQSRARDMISALASGKRPEWARQ